MRCPASLRPASLVQKFRPKSELNARRYSLGRTRRQTFRGMGSTLPIEACACPATGRTALMCQPATKNPAWSNAVFLWICSHDLGRRSSRSRSGVSSLAVCFSLQHQFVAGRKCCGDVEIAERARADVHECNCGAINSESTFRVERSEFSTNPEHLIRAPYGYYRLGIFD